MNQPDEFEQLVSELRSGPVALSAASKVAAQRERILPGLRRAVLATPGRLRRRRTFRIWGSTIALASAAAVLLVSAGILPSSSGSQAHILAEPSAGSSLTVIDPARDVLLIGSATHVAARGEIIAPSAARLTTPGGIRIDLGAGSRVGLDGLDEQHNSSVLQLVRGSVSCRVPRLAKERSFAVRTPDVAVTVHGTEFSVEIGALGAARSCVRVREGLVSVRHDQGTVLLGAGASWGCELRDSQAAASADSNAAERESSKSETRAERAPASKKALAPRRTKPESTPQDEVSGTLADETRLFSAALSAEQRGDHARARVLYQALVQRYPRSPLAEDANRGLRRLK